MAYKGKKLSQMTGAERKVRVAKLLQNPGTRSKVPDQYLPQKLQQQRAMNTRLNAPVTTGSTLTNRDLSHQADTAAQVKYGDAEQQGTQGIGQAQQLAKDQAHWFDDYQAQLAAGRDVQKQIGTQAVDQSKALAGAFAPQDTTGQSAGNAADVGNAAAVRKAILNNIGAVTNSQAANANTYANTLATVVGPGQKLQAQASGAAGVQKARDALAGLLKEKGAFKDQYKSDTIAGEAKNALAQQALGLDITKASTQAKQTDAQLAETKRAHRADEKTAATSAAAKRQAVNQYGYTNADWQAMSTGARQKVIKDFKSSGKGAKDKSPYLAPAGQNTFKRTFDQAKTTAQKLSLGQHYDRGELLNLLKNGRQASTVFIDPTTRAPIPDVYTLADAKKANPKAMPVSVPAVSAITDETVLSAVLDTVLDGHLSPYTIKKLHKAGIKANGLGVSTKRPSATARVVDNAISSVGQAVSGLG